MSTKYDAGDAARLLTASDGRSVALTDHARHRWRMRTPPTCQIRPREAFRRSEPIRDPEIVFESGRDDVVSARVFNVRDGESHWTIVFLVVVDGDKTRRGQTENAELVVPTLLRVRQIEHGPTRSYLNSHGPHYEIEGRR